MENTSVTPKFNSVTFNGREFKFRPEFPLTKFVNTLGRIDFNENGCWIWTGKPNKGGYGVSTYQNKTFPAHRLVFKMMVKDIDKGLHLHHTCKNTLCVNPAHLQAVTPEAHQLLEAEARHVTICKNGHEMSGDNIYRYPGKNRQRCKACFRAYMRVLRRNPRVLRTECHRGHAFDEKNTRWYDGRRYCKACHAENTLRYYHEAVAERSTTGVPSP